jgi:hypothetical protein
MAALGVLNDPGDLDRIEIIAARQHIESEIACPPEWRRRKPFGFVRRHSLALPPANACSYSNA